MNSSKYDQLLKHSKIMLAWAREENWSELLEEETQYVAEVERLNMLGSQDPQDHIQTQRNSLVLEQIMEQSVEIRQRLIDRRDKIGSLMRAEQCRDKLSGAYGVGRPVSVGYMPMDSLPMDSLPMDSLPMDNQSGL